jgi:hypothetical protein
MQNNWSHWRGLFGSDVSMRIWNFRRRVEKSGAGRRLPGQCVPRIPITIFGDWFLRWATFTCLGRLPPRQSFQFPLLRRRWRHFSRHQLWAQNRDKCLQIGVVLPIPERLGTTLDRAKIHELSSACCGMTTRFLMHENKLCHLLASPGCVNASDHENLSLLPDAILW